MLTDKLNTFHLLQISMFGPNAKHKFYREFISNALAEDTDREIIDIETCSLQCSESFSKCIWLHRLGHSVWSLSLVYLDQQRQAMTQVFSEQCSAVIPVSQYGLSWKLLWMKGVWCEKDCDGTSFQMKCFVSVPVPRLLYLSTHGSQFILNKNINATCNNLKDFTELQFI